MTVMIFFRSRKKKMEGENIAGQMRTSENRQAVDSTFYAPASTLQKALSPSFLAAKPGRNLESRFVWSSRIIWDSPT